MKYCLAIALLVFVSCAPSLARPAVADQETYADAPHAVRQEQRFSGSCSMEAVSDAEKHQLIEGYVQRLRTEGKARADAWGKEQGNILRRKLVAKGLCPPQRGDSQTAEAPANSGQKPLLNKQGKACKTVGVENQVFPGFGGEPMTMGLVPVCKD